MDEYAAPVEADAFDIGDADEDEYDEDEDYDEGGDLIGDEEQDDEEQEAPYNRGLEPLPERASAGAGARKAISEPPRRWQGLEELPAATKANLVQLLSKLQAQKRSQITVLLLGKSGVGKSSTTNSLFNEHVASVASMQADATKTTAFSRVKYDFTLTIIDTPGLLETDRVSQQVLTDIAAVIRERQVDVVLYVERFDNHRTDGIDRQLLKSLTDKFGSSIWSNAIVCLTYGSTKMPGISYENYLEGRGRGLRAAIRKAGRNASAPVPVVVVENNPRCKVNNVGERVLPDGSAWLTAVMQEVTNMAASRAPFRYNAAAAERAANPNKQRRWLIPVAILAQIALKVLVFDRLLEEDAITGDKWGPYDPNVVRAARARKAIEEGAKMRSSATAMSGRRVLLSDMSDSSDED